MMLSLAIDMDETMADTTKQINKWYEREFGQMLTAEQLHGKEFRNAVPPGHSGAVHTYLNTPGFFRDIEVYPDAIEVVRELNKKYQVFIVSAATEFPNSLKDKISWLDEFFPYLNWRQYCLCGDKSVVQTDLMIDDRSRNFVHLKGSKTYLYTAHHNVSETAYERVNDWKEVAENCYNHSFWALRVLPHAFTEQGVAMLSSVLNSERAIRVNIQIIRIFTRMRELPDK